YVMESPQYSQREQALANCKFLYGVETEVLTLRYGDGHQALAIGFDSVTESATKLLHTKYHASSTNEAIQYLLQETEMEVAKRFSTNGISIPFTGDLVETITIRRSVSCAPGTTQSEDFELIATPVSNLPEISVTEKENLDENHQVEHDDKGFEGHIQDPAKIEEYALCEPTPEAPVDHNLEWAPLASKKDKKKKKRVIAADGDFEWGTLMPKKDKKKKKRVTAVDEPMHVPEPDPEIPVDNTWRTFFSALGVEKKKSNLANKESVIEAGEDMVEPQPVAEDNGSLHSDSQPELEEANPNMPPEFKSLYEKTTQITTCHSQTQDEKCGHTVVLKIIHSSQNIDH
ncbi:hypothetical protein V491_08896, partial [Pseudogymnoascus sp. VKM F-3775]